jgi:NAD(P)-dependent dehydrogenase (short-subunit alcohol dehydrogenase family)
VAATYGRINILVNNAFDVSSVLSPILDLSVEQLQRNFNTGPIAYLRMMQACHPHLKASGEGRIINFASCAGVIGMASYGPYAMAKEAVRALTRVAAREWGADRITASEPVARGVPGRSNNSGV